MSELAPAELRVALATIRAAAVAVGYSRGDLAQWVANELANLRGERKALFDARADLETERMRLAACGVAALDGRKDSELEADSPYRSASYDDVLALRRKYDAIQRLVKDLGGDLVDEDMRPRDLAAWLRSLIGPTSYELSELRRQLPPLREALEVANARNEQLERENTLLRVQASAAQPANDAAELATAGDADPAPKG